MSSTDDRIVRMQFDNAEFKRRAQETQKSLADVNKAVDSSGKSKGLLNLSSGMQTVAASASKMAVITTTALATIANKVTNLGLQFASSLTFDPIRQGFAEYESLLTKQNVIQNATGKSAQTVKSVLNELNRYSDKTIYNFGNMTDAIQKFVNAGVPLDTSVTTIKGIANAAAFAGANAEEANRAMYAFSQSMSLGFVGLQDWMQIENANLGTIKFKNELLNAAVAAGTLRKEGKGFITESGVFVSATKGWRDGLQEQWATTEVLNKALGKYADTNTKLGRQAFQSATEVRTFTAFMDTLKESLGSGWSQIFTTLIGGLDQSTKLWTGLSKSVGENVSQFFEFTNTAVKSFKALGGMEVILQGFKNIAAPFIAIFKAIGDAWKQAFPGKGPGSGEVLLKMANAFETLTRPLAWFAELIPRIVPFLAIFFKLIALGTTSVADLAVYVGDLVQGLTDMVDLDLGSPSAGGIISFFEGIVGKVGNMFSAGVDFAKNFIEGIVTGFRNGSFDTAANIAGAGLLAGIFVVLKKGLSGGFLGGGILDTIKNTFGQLTNSLKVMQTNIQSKTLMNIAIAIGLLTASVVALSFIDSDRLTKSLTAMAAGFAQLLIAMGILVKISGSAGFVKVPLIAASMVALSSAILILVGAIALMGQLEWETIGKGLAGVAGALVLIGGAMQLMPATLPLTGAGLALVGVGLTAISGAMAIMATMSWETMGKGLAGIAGALVAIAAAMQLMPITLPITAAGLVLVGIALNAIGGALKIMGSMSWEEIGHGLTALGGAMAILAAGLNLMGGTLLGSAGLLVAAAAIAVLVPSLVILSKLSWKSIAKGLVGIGGSLVVLAAGLTLMSASIPGALALLIVAPALLALSMALVALSTLSWEGLGTAIAALAAGLAVLGLAGLALAPVVPALIGLGLALTLMGAGLALAGAGILAFTTGLTLLVGLGAGAVAYLSKYIEAFIELLPEIGAGLGLAIIEGAKVIKEHTPVVVDAIISMITNLLEGVKKLLPKLGQLFGAYLMVVIGVIKKYAPVILNAAGDLIVALIRGLGSKMNEIVSAAVDVIIKFAEGLRDNALKLINAGIDLIAGFLHGLADAIRSGSGKIGSGLADVIDAMKDVGVNMVKGLIKGVKSMAGEALGSITGLAGDMVSGAADFLGIKSPSKVFANIGMFLVQGLTQGIQHHAAAAINSVASMVGGQIAVANEYISKYIQQLDQKAISARSRADGLRAAAERAQKAAEKTKTEKDDAYADKLLARANRADRLAEALESRVDTAKEAQDKKEEFRNASLLEKAQMRSEDAQNELDRAKAAEARANKRRTEANALDRTAKQFSGAERKRLEAEADELRALAAKDAKTANTLLSRAKKSAADALKYQKLAGAEAAAAFQAAFDADAKAAADEAAFEKLSNAEKAAMRKKQAEDLQKKAAADLASAKKLAYKDIEAANELASIAMAEAEQARRYLEEAQNFSNQTNTTGIGGGILGTVVNLDPGEDAAMRMRQYEDLYDTGVAAAAADRTYEFNQYNTSPEALSPTETYRLGNNMFAFAVEKIDDASTPD